MEVDLEHIPTGVKSLCAKLRDAGYGAWLVGGGLRDILRGDEPKDWDIATSAPPASVMSLFRRVIPTGLEHGTVTVFHRGSGYEVTTLRGEGAYTDSRRPDSVHFVDDVELDLARRDFTINAIAYDPSSSELIDPFGGVKDLHKRRIRTVGSAAARFGEDGLRVLRAARFVATLNFDLDGHTEAAIPGALNAFSAVSAERVRDEWLKALRAQHASRAFEVMRRTGILEITCPKLAALVDCPELDDQERGAWQTTLRRLDACKGDSILRLASLLQDIEVAEPPFAAANPPGSARQGPSLDKGRLVDEWMRAFRFSNEQRVRVTHLIRQIPISYSSNWTDAGVRKFIKRVGHASMPDVFALARADATASEKQGRAAMDGLAELEARADAQIAAGAVLHAKDLALSGKELMTELGLEPSRLIGAILEGLLQAVLDNPRCNTRAQLVELAIGIKNEERSNP